MVFASPSPTASPPIPRGLPVARGRSRFSLVRVVCREAEIRRRKGKKRGRDEEQVPVGNAREQKPPRWQQRLGACQMPSDPPPRATGGRGSPPFTQPEVGWSWIGAGSPEIPQEKGGQKRGPESPRTPEAPPEWAPDPQPLLKGPLTFIMSTVCLTEAFFSKRVPSLPCSLGETLSTRPTT